MIKKTLLVVTSVAAVLAAVAYVMYLRNPTPAVAAISAAEAANPSKPFVVKLHAQWCPVCMVTKTVWSRIEATYSGRVNLVVFDFTNQTTTDTSRAEARRLGLEEFFENTGSTGTIAVLDGRSRKVLATINGSRDFAEYQAAINSALATAPK